jgi:hypothetical protein
VWYGAWTGKAVTDDEDDDALTVSRVVVERRVHGDGTLVDWFEATDTDGEPLRWWRRWGCSGLRRTRPYARPWAKR